MAEKLLVLSVVLAMTAMVCGGFVASDSNHYAPWLLSKRPLFILKRGSPLFHTYLRLERLSKRHGKSRERSKRMLDFCRRSWCLGYCKDSHITPSHITHLKMAPNFRISPSKINCLEQPKMRCRKCSLMKIMFSKQIRI